MAIDTIEGVRSRRAQRFFPGVGFILSMAFYQLGDEQHAREEYERTVTLLNDQKYHDPDALRFRDEANDMLGIESAKTSSSEETKGG